MIASKRTAKRQAVLQGRRLARKIVKGFTCLGVPQHVLPNVAHLEKPKHYVAVNDDGVPEIEIRTPKAHALHLMNILGKVNQLRKTQEQDPNRKMAAQIMEVLNELGNPAKQAQRAHKMRDVELLNRQAKKLEEEMGEKTDEQADAKEEGRQLPEDDGSAARPNDQAAQREDSSAKVRVDGEHGPDLPRDAVGTADDKGV
jgi:hypothetical protein